MIFAIEGQTPAKVCYTQIMKRKMEFRAELLFDGPEGIFYGSVVDARGCDDVFMTCHWLLPRLRRCLIPRALKILTAPAPLSEHYETH